MLKKIENADMKEYTSFRAGGHADVMYIPENEEEIKEALQEIDEEGLDLLMIGNGSDTLVTDGGFHGAALKLGEGFSYTKIEGEKLICGASELLSRASKAACEASLSGMETISGIPGSIGGAIFMDAGAYGGEIKDILESVTAIKRETGEKVVLPAEELDLSYRHSIFMETGDIMTEAVFRLKKGDREEIASLMAEYTKKRNDKQPLDLPSAGSFFKRPEGYFAGKLIEDAGLKGLAVGGAQVSEKHSGFIVNAGGATATDIIRLMRLVQNTVYDRSGVMLEPEVRIVGEPALEEGQDD